MNGENEKEASVFMYGVKGSSRLWYWSVGAENGVEADVLTGACQGRRDYMDVNVVCSSKFVTRSTHSSIPLSPSATFNNVLFRLHNNPYTFPR